MSDTIPLKGDNRMNDVSMADVRPGDYIDWCGRRVCVLERRVDAYLSGRRRLAFKVSNVDRELYYESDEPAVNWFRPESGGVGTIRDQLAARLAVENGGGPIDRQAEWWCSATDLADVVLNFFGSLDPDADGELVASHLLGDGAEIARLRAVAEAARTLVAVDEWGEDHVSYERGEWVCCVGCTKHFGSHDDDCLVVALRSALSSLDQETPE